VACALAVPAARAPAEGERAADDPAGRAWRTIQRVPRQIGAATRRAYREFEEGLAAGRRRAPRPVAPAPVDPAASAHTREPGPARPPLPPAPREPAPAARAGDPAVEAPLDALPGPGESAAEEAFPFAATPAGAAPADPALAPPVPRELVAELAGAAPRAVPAGSQRPPAAHGTGLRRAALLGAFAAALAGAGLSLRRRRRAPETAAAPTLPAPPAAAPRAAPATTAAPAATVPFAVTADALPEPSAAAGTPAPLAGSGERTTRARTAPGFDPTPLDARTEAALAAALARDADDRPTPFPGGGRYELIAEIGRGGMGVVYQARDKRLDRIVALKRLPENLQSHPRAVQLLLREARSAARLNHPHIVTVYDVDHEDGAYFLTMEYLDGHPLSTLLHRRGRFSAAEAAWLGRQAAAGLSYAHERRIVHRDVKTANLFLTRDRVLKIMDFGLAKMMEAVRRHATRIGGTPDYMAPEQTLGLEVDGRADLYGLGVTLFELLTGTVPFEQGDALRHHRETPPPDPRERAPDTPAALAELVLALLAKKPEERPASALVVVGRLRAIELAVARATVAG
jgi:tRNA A-37 threonylcarbamoyl transferase component Bud32